MSFSPDLQFDVQRDINPRNLYRPINNATWTTLVSGKVSVLKDNGRGTARDLTQSTDANRPVHGTDSRGNEFQDHGSGETWLDAATKADWTWGHDPPEGSGVTVASIVEVDSVSATQNIIAVTSDSSATNGWRMHVNGSVGSGFHVYRTTGNAVSCTTGTNNNGPTGIYVIVSRWRELDDDSQGADPENRVSARLRVNGVELIVNQPRQSTYTGNEPLIALRVGSSSAGTVGLTGKLYELALDDRWWSDDLVMRYEQRAITEFGADKMIL